MSKPEEGEEIEGRPGSHVDDRYAAFTAGGEQVVIYDQEERAAWVQSTVGFDLDNTQ